MSKTKELVDVWGSPLVNYNLTFSGNVTAFANVSSAWTLGPGYIYGVQVKPSLTVSVSGTIKVGIAANNLKHDWSVPQGLDTTGFTGSATAFGTIGVVSTGAQENPVGYFGIQSFTIESGLAVTLAATGMWNSDTMTLTVSFGVRELHPFIKVHVTYTNGKISQSFEIGADLGWLQASISFDIIVPRGIFLN